MIGQQNPYRMAQEAELSWYREANEMLPCCDGDPFGEAASQADADELMAAAEHVAMKLRIRGCPPKFMEKWVHDFRAKPQRR